MFQKLALLLEPEIARMLEGQAARIAGHDDVKLDIENGQISYLCRGMVLWDAMAEYVGTYTRDFGLWRWWWTGARGKHRKTRVDIAFAEGQRHNVPTLLDENPHLANEQDAALLAHVTAQLARADGVHYIRNGERMAFYALFEENRSSRRSRPAAPVASGPPSAPASRPSRPSAGYSAMPPAAALQPPPAPRLTDSHLDDPFAETTMPTMRPSLVTLVPQDDAHARPVRDPSRELVQPMASQALALVAQALPDGFHQALLVVNVDVVEGKARFFTQLVASDARYELQALDTSKGLLEAVARMIGEDARSGNGRWRRLVLRMARTERGAAVDVKIK